MAEPKKKLTRTRRGWRRSHDALRSLSLSKCPKCNEPKLPHMVCLNCGTYRGETVLVFKDKKKQQ